MQRPYQSRAVCIPARSQTTDDVLWLAPSPGCKISFGKSPKNRSKNPCCTMFLKRLFSPVVCVSWFLVVLVSLTQHNLVVSSSEIRSCIFFARKKTTFRDLWGSLKRVTNFQGYWDQGRELFQGRLWPEWVPIKGYRMEVDIGIAPFRQVAAAPIKVPNRKLCKSYLRKGLEVAGEFEKKSKSLLYVSNITGKSIYLSVTLAQIW